jgi:hypothetical protein
MNAKHAHVRLVDDPTNTEAEGHHVEDIVDALLGAVVVQMAAAGLRGDVGQVDHLRSTIREIAIGALRRDQHSATIDAVSNMTMQRIVKALGHCGHRDHGGSRELRAEVREQVAKIVVETGEHDIRKLCALMLTAIPKWVAVAAARDSQ